MWLLIPSWVYFNISPQACLFQGWFIKAHLPECFIFIPVCISLPTYCTCGVACHEGWPTAVNLFRNTVALHKASLMLHPSLGERSRKGFCPYAQACPIQAPNKSHCKVKEKLTCLSELVPFIYSSLCCLFVCLGGGWCFFVRVWIWVWVFLELLNFLYLQERSKNSPPKWRILAMLGTPRAGRALCAVVPWKHEGGRELRAPAELLVHSRCS